MSRAWNILSNVAGWRYLFARGDNPSFCSWWRRVLCRWRNHPCGPIYYNAGGLEPDDRCQECGDYLG